MPTKKNIRTPEDLYELFEEYKKHCKANPKLENFYNQREDKQVSIQREVPITWTGFEVYLFKKKIISRLDDYRYNRDERYSEYVYIIDAMDKEIYEDKFAGATAGIYKHNIIALDLGMVAKTETKNEGKIDIVIKRTDEGL